MEIDLIYIEAEHDEVPGIVRELAADETSAKVKTQELLKTGAHVYQQTMSVEITAYNHLDVEAALCVWEHLDQLTLNTGDPKWIRYREGVGSFELRHESIEIGKWALKVYDLLPEWYRDGRAYDWEIIPAIIDTMIPGETRPEPAEAAKTAINTEEAKQEYLRAFDWHLKKFYAIGVKEGAGMTDEQFFQNWFDPSVEPQEQVAKFAENYGLGQMR